MSTICTLLTLDRRSCPSGGIDFEQFIDEAEQAQGQLGGGKPPRLPAHFALNYEPATELHPELRKEASKHRWEVASPRAYPWMVSIDTDLVGRPPTSKEKTKTRAKAKAAKPSRKKNR